MAIRRQRRIFRASGKVKIECVLDWTESNVTTPETSAKAEELGARLDARWMVLETKIEEQGAELQAKIDAKMEELGARMDAQTAQIASLGSRIDDLRVLMLRVIWPLIILLAVPIFGELYRTLSAR